MVLKAVEKLKNRARTAVLSLSREEWASCSRSVINPNKFDMQTVEGPVMGTLGVWGVPNLVIPRPSWCERSVQSACSHPVPQDVLLWALELGRMFFQSTGTLWRWRLRLKRCWRTPQSWPARAFSTQALMWSGPAAFLCSSLSSSLLTWLAVMWSPVWGEGLGQGLWWVTAEG